MRFIFVMADEVTDSSNREQLVVCLRWVDENMDVQEDFLGLYQVPNIASDTIVKCLRDVLIRMNLSINNCRRQCYDGASNMKGHKKGVATQIFQEEGRALYTHCYGHSLNLAIADTVREIKLLQDTLDLTSEILKLLKYSPKRDTMFVKLKEELSAGTPSFRTLCPTRCTVRAISLKSVLDNYIPLMELWEDYIEEKLDSETKSRIIGVKSQMGTFEYYFGQHLGFLILVIPIICHETFKALKNLQHRGKLSQA